MREKLDCVMLVDDDKATNWLHQIIITKCQCAKKIVVKTNGKDALDYLLSPDREPRVNLILLDMNMPVMDGWEFLEKYKEHKLKSGEEIIVAMLTSSLNPDDEKRALATGMVNGFHCKPLDTAQFKALLVKYFPDKV